MRSVRYLEFQIVGLLLVLLYSVQRISAATIVSDASPFDVQNVSFAGSTLFDSSMCLECMCEDYTGLSCNVSELCGTAQEGRDDVCDLLGIEYAQWQVTGKTTMSDDSKLDYETYLECKHNSNCSAQVVINFLNDYQRKCPQMQRTCVNYVAVQVYGALSERCERNPAGQRLPPLRRARIENCLVMKSSQAAGKVDIAAQASGRCDLMKMTGHFCEFYVPSFKEY